MLTTPSDGGKHSWIGEMRGKYSWIGEMRSKHSWIAEMRGKHSWIGEMRRTDSKSRGAKSGPTTRETRTTAGTWKKVAPLYILQAHTEGTGAFCPTGE